MSKKKQGIEVYLRVRPTKKPFAGLGLTNESGKVEFNFKRDGLRNNEIRDDYYNFVYNGIFDMLTKQEQVFDDVAKDVIDTCFEGYNGTIFAYGQTGSGKTFTITGGAERYADRGIIPRTLSYIFSQIKKDDTTRFQVSVSYLEIYNETGFDLLDENHASKNLYDLQKVKMYEDKQGHFNMQNLSVHRAENEEDALNLLFIGDTNRVVSETPKNDASTRSHCIFMIQIESHKIGSDVKRRSKLHIVDLAGSERIAKTGVEDKTTIQESKNINSSLFMLQMVITALNKKAKEPDTHVPFRNSMMTMILRDSLGGNCRTKMIATISASKDDIEESLGTCRFARSVQMVQNDMKKNETVDPGVIITRLKKEVADLKAEINLLKGGKQKDHLTQDDINHCNGLVSQYIKTNDPEETLVLADRLMINQCFYQFRTLLRNAKAGKGGPVEQGSPSKGEPRDDESNLGQQQRNQESDAEVARLNMLVKQRDNEIAILLNYLNKQKEQGSNQGVPVHRPNESTRIEESKDMGTPSHQSEGNTLYKMMQPSGQKPIDNKTATQKRMDFDLAQSTMKTTEPNFNKMNDLTGGIVQISDEDLADRAKAFETFRKSYRKNEAMEENRALLKSKYQRGKELGMSVNGLRTEIKNLTNEIEQIRRQNAMRGLVDENGEIIRTDEEKLLQQKITTRKQSYQEDYNELKDLKSEIERIQNLLERCRVGMQKDFEQWLTVMVNHKKATGNAFAQGVPAMNQNQNYNGAGMGMGMGGNNMQPPPQQMAPQLAATSNQVTDNLKDFYAARNAIYQDIGKN